MKKPTIQINKYI